jgi:excisionase family DNA binding protein
MTTRRQLETILQGLPRRITTAQAAEALGIEPDSIRKLIYRGKLPAEKVGRDWLILKRDLLKVRERIAGNPEWIAAGKKRRKRRKP